MYASSSLALAVLEVLAYRKARRPLTPRHLYRVSLNDAQIAHNKTQELPDDWMTYPYPQSTQALGDAWAAARETLALAVPSVLAPHDHNIVLNCAHPDFTNLNIEGPEVFPISPRLTPDLRDG